MNRLIVIHTMKRGDRRKKGKEFNDSTEKIHHSFSAHLRTSTKVAT